MQSSASITLIHLVISIIGLSFIGHEAVAKECLRYDNYGGEIIGIDNVKITGTLSSPCDRGRYCFSQSEVPDAIKFQIYNGKSTPINIRVTFSSGNVYDLDKVFPVNQSSTKLLFPQKEDLDSSFSWNVIEVIKKCSEWEKTKKELKAEEQRARIFNACVVEKSKDVDTNQPGVRRSVYNLCNVIADNPSWLDRLRYN